MFSVPFMFYNHIHVLLFLLADRAINFPGRSTLCHLGVQGFDRPLSARPNRRQGSKRKWTVKLGVNVRSKLNSLESK